MTSFQLSNLAALSQMMCDRADAKKTCLSATNLPFYTDINGLDRFQSNGHLLSHSLIIIGPHLKFNAYLWHSPDKLDAIIHNSRLLVQSYYARTADAAWTWTINWADSERSAKIKPVLLQDRMNPGCTYCNYCDSQWFFNRVHSIIIQRCLLARVPFTISLPTWIAGWSKRNNRQRVRITTKREAFGSVHLCVTVHWPGTRTDWLTDWSLLFYINYQCEEQQRSFLWHFTPSSISICIYSRGQSLSNL